MVVVNGFGVGNFLFGEFEVIIWVEIEDIVV